MEIKATGHRFAINILIRVYGSNSSSKRGYVALTFTYQTRRTRPEQIVR